MEQKVISNPAERTCVLRLETGDEVVSMLPDFCKDQHAGR